jgi:hypothetical protein
MPPMNKSSLTNGKLLLPLPLTEKQGGHKTVMPYRLVIKVKIR